MTILKEMMEVCFHDLIQNQKQKGVYYLNERGKLLNIIQQLLACGDEVESDYFIVKISKSDYKIYIYKLVVGP